MSERKTTTNTNASTKEIIYELVKLDVENDKDIDYDGFRKYFEDFMDMVKRKSDDADDTIEKWLKVQIEEEKNNRVYHLALGEVYKYGFGTTEKNRELCMKHLNISHELGHFEGTRILAMAYYQGDLIEKDILKSIELFNNTIEKRGNWIAYRDLATLYGTLNIKEGLDLGILGDNLISALAVRGTLMLRCLKLEQIKRGLDGTAYMYTLKQMKKIPQQLSDMLSGSTGGKQMVSIYIGSLKSFHTQMQFGLIKHPEPTFFDDNTVLAEDFTDEPNYEPPSVDDMIQMDMMLYLSMGALDIPDSEAPEQPEVLTQILGEEMINEMNNSA